MSAPRTLVIEHDGKTLVVDGSPVTIGRGSACAVRVIHPLVSREHVRIELRDDGVFAVDLGSSNGTWVNDDALHGSRRVLRGDRLRMGRDGPEIRFVRAEAGGKDLLDPDAGDLATMAADDPRAKRFRARVELGTPSAPAAPAPANPEPAADPNRTGPIDSVALRRLFGVEADGAPGASSPVSSHATSQDAPEAPAPTPRPSGSFGLGLAAGLAAALAAAALILALTGGGT